MENEQRESLEDEATHATDEARMVLPGVQAILGFQLVAVFNQRFHDLTDRLTGAYDEELGVKDVSWLTPAATEMTQGVERKL
jgi:hypothetical protein